MSTDGAGVSPLRTWQDLWQEVFEDEPLYLTSRETSLQEKLSVLIAGRRLPWDIPERPTTDGARFLRSFWQEAFGDAPDADLEWFVSEYRLPAPPEWREEIGREYNSPDFACGVADRILIIELKTEPRSY